MKKFIYFIVLFAICLQPVALLAQDDDQAMYKGLRFGYQNSNLSESDWGELSSFYAGIFAVKKLGTGIVSMYTGLEYYETGSREDDDNKIVLSYLSLPINLRVKVGPAYAFGGVNPSFKVAESFKVGGVDVSDQADISGFDMGGQLGLGAKIAFIGVEIKYNLGFIGITEETSLSSSSTTSHLQAGLCVYF